MMINGKHFKLFRKNKFSWVNNMFCSFLLLSVSDKKIISKSYWVATIVEYTGWKNFNAQSVYYTIISDVFPGSIPGATREKVLLLVFTGPLLALSLGILRNTSIKIHFNLIEQRSGMPTLTTPNVTNWGFLDKMKAPGNDRFGIVHLTPAGLFMSLSVRIKKQSQPTTV